MAAFRWILIVLLGLAASAQAATTTTATIQFAWNSNTEPGLAGYRMYSSDRSDGTFDTVVDPQIAPSGQPEVSYTGNLVVPSGGTVYIVVTAFSNTGSESLHSNVISYTDPAPATCGGDAETRTVKCTAPYKGEVQQIRYSSCPDGQEVWGDWTWLSGTCVRGGKR